MPDGVQNVKEVTTRTGDTIQKTTELHNPQADAEHSQDIAEGVVWFIAGVTLVLLAFRFLLSLLGANTTNSLANFVYSVSYPFVAPFFSLFNYSNYTNGVSHFEVYTLVAILFYALVAWGIAKLLTLNRHA